MRVSDKFQEYQTTQQTSTLSRGLRLKNEKGKSQRCKKCKTSTRDT